MANIKQAAKWLQEGKRVIDLEENVRRVHFVRNGIIWYDSDICGEVEASFEPQNLLSDKWEIAE